MVEEEEEAAAWASELARARQAAAEQARGEVRFELGRTLTLTRTLALTLTLPLPLPLPLPLTLTP